MNNNNDNGRPEYLKKKPVLDALFPIGVVGLIALDHLLFLPSGLEAALQWVFAACIAAFIIVRLVLAINYVRAQNKARAGGARIGRKKKTDKKTFPASTYLISISIIALGLALIFVIPVGYSSLQHQLAASDWPSVGGQVVGAKVLVDEKIGSEPDMYQPQVVTQYTVEGRAYVIREVHFNQSSSWRSNSDYAYEVVDKYRPGTAVEVYYKPGEPYVAVLDTSVQFFTFFIISLGAALTLLGLYLFWISLRDTFWFLRNLFDKAAT